MKSFILALGTVTHSPRTLTDVSISLGVYLRRQGAVRLGVEEERAQE